MRHLREAILSGRPWHLALLEAIGLWTLPEESFQGQRYRYLLLGEAFDWLVLAERLSAEVDSLIPREELEALLFHGRFPQEVSSSQLRSLMGPNKYRAFLNYWYGVVVEEALQLAVEEEVRKERRSKGLPDSEGLTNAVFLRIYGESQDELLKRFRKESGHPRRTSLTLTEAKEFTYWLFKRRLRVCEPAKVASDTRKGLERLARLRGTLLA